MAAVSKRTWKTRGGTKSAWCVDWVDGLGKRQRKQFSTKREADARRIEIESLLKSGTFRPDAHKITVAKLGAEFIAHCEGRNRRGERMTRAVLANYKGQLTNYIVGGSLDGMGQPRSKFLGAIGALKLAQLTSRRVNEFKDTLREAGVSVPTTRKILATLHNMLQFARSNDYIATNPAENIRVIGKRNEGSEKVSVPSKEVVQLLIAAADEKFCFWLRFSALTGLRAGEFHALRWHHINMSRGEVRVETRVDRYGHEDGQGAKTSAGNRLVPMNDFLIAELKKWRLMSSFSTDKDLVFPNTKGLFENHDNMVSQRFRPLFVKVIASQTHDSRGELIQPFTWHALRHFAISLWIEVGFSQKAVQTFAGHSSLQMTMDRYGHLFPSDDHQNIMNRITDSFDLR